MRCVAVGHQADHQALAPVLLGQDGRLRAFTLVAPDRPALTLAAWLAETDDGCLRHDRPLDTLTGPIPCSGLVGLTAPTGCLFAVFGYTVESGPPGRARLMIRGPSWNAPMGGRMVPDGIEATIMRLAGELGCPQILRQPW